MNDGDLRAEDLRRELEEERGRTRECAGALARLAKGLEVAIPDAAPDDIVNVALERAALAALDKACREGVPNG
jgi:hypothetical protein